MSKEPKMKRGAFMEVLWSVLYVILAFIAFTILIWIVMHIIYFMPVWVRYMLLFLGFVWLFAMAKRYG